MKEAKNISNLSKADLEPLYSVTKVSPVNFQLYNFATKKISYHNTQGIGGLLSSLTGKVPESFHKELQERPQYSTFTITANALKGLKKVADKVENNPWKVVMINGQEYIVEDAIEKETKENSDVQKKADSDYEYFVSNYLNEHPGCSIEEATRVWTDFNKEDVKKEASAYTDFVSKYMKAHPGVKLGEAAKAWKASKSPKAEVKPETKAEVKAEAALKIAEPEHALNIKHDVDSKVKERILNTNPHELKPEDRLTLKEWPELSLEYNKKHQVYATLKTAKKYEVVYSTSEGHNDMGYVEAESPEAAIANAKEFLKAVEVLHVEEMPSVEAELKTKAEGIQYKDETGQIKQPVEVGVADAANAPEELEHDGKKYKRQIVTE